MAKETPLNGKVLHTFGVLNYMRMGHDPGYLALDSEYWLLDPGFWMLAKPKGAGDCLLRCSLAVGCTDDLSTTAPS